MRSHFYFSVTFSWKTVVFSSVETCLDMRLSRSVLLRYWNQKGTPDLLFQQQQRVRRFFMKLFWWKIPQQSWQKLSIIKSVSRVFFIFKLVLSPSFRALNNVRKLRATPQQSYLNQRKLAFRPGNMFCVCHAHRLAEKKVMDDSLCIFSLLNHHLPLTQFLAFYNVCQGVNGLQPVGKYLPVKFSGLCLIKLPVHALDWRLLPNFCFLREVSLHKRGWDV